MPRMLIIALFVLLTSCGTPNDPIPTPLEAGTNTMGFYCGMALSEHPGPKGQIHVAGETAPLWFTSVRESFTYLQMDGATRRIRAFYVNDMGNNDWNAPQPHTWILAQMAFFVMDSSKHTGVGTTEIIPFREQTQAEAFIKQYGGRIATYQEVSRMETWKE